MSTTSRSPALLPKGYSKHRADQVTLHCREKNILLLGLVFKPFAALFLQLHSLPIAPHNCLNSGHPGPVHEHSIPILLLPVSSHCFLTRKALPSKALLKQPHFYKVPVCAPTPVPSPETHGSYPRHSPVILYQASPQKTVNSLRVGTLTHSASNTQNKHLLNRC